MLREILTKENNVIQVDNCTLNKCSAVAEMSDRLATIGMGRKWGGAAAAVGGWVPTGSHVT